MLLLLLVQKPHFESNCPTLSPVPDRYKTLHTMALHFFLRATASREINWLGFHHVWGVLDNPASKSDLQKHTWTLSEEPLFFWDSLPPARESLPTGATAYLVFKQWFTILQHVQCCRGQFIHKSINISWQGDVILKKWKQNLKWI